MAPEEKKMKINKTRIAAMASTALLSAQMFVTNAFAASEGGSGIPQTGFSKVVEPIINLLDQILWPLIAVVGAVGALYCVLLGIKFAKAEEPQDREKAKSHLKNAIIGFVLIFVLMVVLKLLTPVMVQWVSSNS